MKLAVLEFRRVLTRKWILVWFVLLLGVGLWVSVLFTEQQFSNTGINLERYLYLTRQYAEMPVLQVREQAETQVKRLEQISALYLSFRQGQPVEGALTQSLGEAGYDANDLSSEHFIQINLDRAALRRISQEAEIAAGYRDWLLRIQQGTSGLSGIALFEEDPYVTKTREKAMADYADLKPFRDEWLPNIPISVFLQNRVMESFGALFLLTVVMLLFTDEKEKGYGELTGTTLRGRGRFWFAKAAVIFVCTAAVTALYEGALLWFLLQWMGGAAWNAPIQLTAGFESCHWNLTTLQAVLLTFLLKCLLLYLLVLLVSAAACVVKKNISLLIGIASVCLLAALWLQNGEINGNAGWLFCLNPLMFSHSAALLLTYRVVPFFGHPVENIQIVAAAALCILFFVLPAGSLLYGRTARRKRLRFVRSGKIRTGKPRSKRHPLTVLELKKLLLSGKLIYPLSAIAILGSWYYLTASDMNLSIQEHYYMEYMKQLNGPLTEEKERFLEEERVFFERVDTLLEALQEEDNPVLRNYLETLLIKQAAFQQAEAQYNRIVSNGGNGVFLYETGYLYLLGASHNAKGDMGVLATAIILSIFLPYFSWAEYRKGAADLVRTSPRGRQTLMRVQFRVYLLITALPLFILYAEDAARILRQFGTYGIFQDMANLDAFAAHFHGWRLWEVLALIGVLRLFGIALAVLISVRAMAFFKDYLKTVLFCGLVIVLPCILRLLGLSFLKGYFFNALLWGNELFIFRNNENLSAIFAVLLQCAALVAVCGIYERKTRTAKT